MSLLKLLCQLSSTSLSLWKPYAPCSFVCSLLEYVVVIFRCTYSKKLSIWENTMFVFKVCCICFTCWVPCSHRSQVTTRLFNDIIDIIQYLNISTLSEECHSDVNLSVLFKFMDSYVDIPGLPSKLNFRDSKINFYDITISI